MNAHLLSCRKDATYLAYVFTNGGGGIVSIIAYNEITHAISKVERESVTLFPASLSHRYHSRNDGRRFFFNLHPK